MANLHIEPKLHIIDPDTPRPTQSAKFTCNLKGHMCSVHPLTNKPDSLILECGDCRMSIRPDLSAQRCGACGARKFKVPGATQPSRASDVSRDRRIRRGGYTTPRLLSGDYFGKCPQSAVYPRARLFLLIGAVPCPVALIPR